ncbi:DEAD/DEAH box helicase, partial [Sinorhizobium medicae]
MTELAGIAPAIAEALAKRGYETLTPVQQAMLDPALGTADALVSAQTGSGKTVAFGLALAPTLIGSARQFAQPGAPLALVIAPTRELALQVKRELEWLYEIAGATIASCVGGMDMRSERRMLDRGAHIVVGTPGRLCDHIRRGSLDISELKAVVLDEADEMLDLGFREDLEFILEAAPADRRTLMFSATVPRSIATLAKNYQRDAVRIGVTSEQKQHGDIEYRALLVAPSDRENAIINVLRFYEARNAIVFCSTRAAVNHLTARFNNRGFSVVALSGELSQNERTHALQAMRDGRARVCIATDVAARGIDLPGLELVIHADLPTNSDTLLHRSGRTGRAGQKGVSALIVPVNARRKAERLLENARITAAWAKPPSADEVALRDDERIAADPALAEPPREDEQAIVETLIGLYGAEKIAAAFVRQFRSNRSAPEELAEVAVYDDRKKARRESPAFSGDSDPAPRADFADGRWFSLSVGRKQNAEPRWLIPMLCRHGKLSKRDIGAIRMQPEETYVEMTADGAERLLTAIGPDRMLERGIRVKALPGAPDVSRSRQDRP